MKIQCQSCQAKYTIADEKVLGKVVKIRCKKCSATIVINGNEVRGEAHGTGVEDNNAETHVFDYAGQANDPWTVNVADGDQRTMTVQEIVREYRAGTVDDETYCWKDGMADWLPLREIEQLHAAVKLGRVSADSVLDDISLPPQSGQPGSQGGALGGLFSSNEVASAVDGSFAGANGSGSSNGNGHYRDAPEQGQAAPAARRGGGRGQGADLFGNVASAGGEEDVMTSAATAGGFPMSSGGGGHGGAMEEQKLTGQRNESSVLFSLSALTDGGKSDANAAMNRSTATSDGSGLIDIRALSQTMGSEDKRETNARVDDIMNLSGGGAFGAALAAPILAPPPLEMSNDYGMYGQSGSKSNKMLLIAIVVGAAFIAIGIVVAVGMTRPNPPVADTSPTSTTSALGAPPLASANATAASDPSSAGTGASAATGAGDTTPPPPGTGNATSKAPASTGASSPRTTGGGGGGGNPFAAPKDNSASAAAVPAPVKTAEPPKDLAGALAGAVGRKEEAPHAAAGGGSTAPFDRGAAQAALGNINVQSCKKSDGPTGSGHVKITFTPDGQVSQAVIDGGPFPGTSVGGCIAGKFRGAHIPPFGGGPVSVGKSFTVN